MKKNTVTLTNYFIYILILFLLIFLSVSCINIKWPVQSLNETSQSTATSEATFPSSPQYSVSRIEKLGAEEYEIQDEIVFHNQGPGIISRLLLRMALITTRDPYQQVIWTKIGSTNYKKNNDLNNNMFAEIELTNLKPLDQAQITIAYRIAISHLKFTLEPCSGTSLSEFLQPEKWIESDNQEIIALASQLTKDKISPCEKARAIYDWIGNSIKYGGYSGVDKGALYCFNTRTGDCSEFSYLMISMCRAIGIPARFVEGYVYEPGKTKIADVKHDWLEIYVPGTGWVPVDPTWGRFKPYRDKYFAAMTSDHIVMTIGHPNTMAKWESPFHYFEYYFWWANKESKVSYTENMQINIVK